MNKLRKLLEELPSDFAGRLEITFQSGEPRVVHKTETITLNSTPLKPKSTAHTAWSKNDYNRD